MVAFILSIAVVNIAVGFATAAYLGWRYHRLLAMEINSSPSTFLENEMLVPGLLEPAPLPVGDTTPEGSSPPPSERFEPKRMPAAAPTATEPMRTEETRTEETRTEEARAPETPVHAAAVEADVPPAPRQPGPTETAITELQGQVNLYQEQVLDVDSLLRQFSEAPDAPQVEACLQTFHRANGQYLESRNKACQSLQESQADEGFAASALEDLRAAVELQTQRIESAQAAVESFDYLGDLGRACKQMTGQTVELADANHAVRDVIDQAWATAAAARNWQPRAEAAHHDGSKTRPADRAGLEAALARWRETTARSATPLCMAAIDLDHFAGVNEHFGPRTGDRLLQSLAQLLVREGSHNNIVGRVSGQRFVVLFPQMDLRLTTSVVERIRQMVEISHFQFHDDEIRVTVSCAVVEAEAEDDLAALLARAEAAIQESKRYGRNRTFLYEGEYPTPVVPPNFALEEKFVAL